MTLEVRHLDSFYGRAQILFDVSLSVGPGEVVALLGRNGAGKSTTLRSLMGLTDRVRGRILFESRSIRALPTHEIACLGLGYVPEDRRIFTDLTVRENLSLAAPRSRAGPWTLERLLALFPNLAEMLDRSAGAISGGEQQMLTIARALAGHPSLLMLDEPSEGLAPLIVEQLGHAIAEMKASGVSVLLSEQNLSFCLRAADRARILEQGRVRFSGTTAELAAQPEISHAYLAV